MSEMPDGWWVDVDGGKVVVNFPVKGDYGHRVLSRHQARLLRTQLRRLWRRRREYNTAQSAVTQLVGSTKTIMVADQLHLSWFAGDVRRGYRRARSNRPLDTTSAAWRIRCCRGHRCGRRWWC